MQFARRCILFGGPLAAGACAVYHQQSSYRPCVQHPVQSHDAALSGVCTGARRPLSPPTLASSIEIASAQEPSDVGVKASTSQRVVVIGAGLTGVLTAYELLKRGNSVLLVDSAATVAAATSAGACGMIRPTHVHPMDPIALLKDMVVRIFDKETRDRTWWLIFRPHALWNCWDFAHFLFHSVRAGWWNRAVTTENNAAALADSWNALVDALDDTEISPESFELSWGSIDVWSTVRDFDKEEAESNKIRIHCSRVARSPRYAPIEAQQSIENGFGVKTLAATELHSEESSLSNWHGLHAVGGRLHASNARGDTRAFTTALVAHCRKRWPDRFTVELGTHVVASNLNQLSRPSPPTTLLPAASSPLKVTELFTAGGRKIANFDSVVVCAGVWTPPLARTLGIRNRIPIMPIKGYSISIPLNGNPSWNPKRGVAFPDQHLWFNPIGAHELRVSSIAEFSGYDARVDPQVLSKMKAQIMRLLPDAPVEDATAWSGLRPMTPDDLPLLGRASKTDPENVLLCAGVGMKGFLLAFGAARNIARSISGTHDIPANQRADRFFSREGASSQDRRQSSLLTNPNKQCPDNAKLG